MGSKISKRKRINILLVTLFILVAPFSLYFLLYYGGQKDYFTNRNFRLLAVLGRGIEKKVEAIGNAYSNGADKVARGYYKPGDKCEPLDSKDLELLKTESLSSVLDARQLQTVTITSEPQSSDRMGLTIEIKRQGGTRWLNFDYVERPPAAGISSTGKPLDPCPPIGIHAQSNLDDFVAAFFNRFVNGKDFNSVFIADADGTVLYQWSPNELGLTDFNALTTRNQGKIDFERFKQNGNVADVVVAETDYKFFAQPIDLSLPRTNSQDKHPIKWVTGGLVRTVQLNSESRAISYTILIVFTFLLILVVLSFPFLKLVFMRAKDVMGVADIYFLAFSTLVGSAVLTAFLAYTLIYFDLEHRMDDQLIMLSNQIVRNFEAEVGSACQQLEVLNRKVKSSLDVAQESDKAEKPPTATATTQASNETEKTRTAGTAAPSASPLADEIPTGCGDAKEANGQYPRKRCFRRTDIPVDQLEDYPYLTIAAWVDPGGQQRIKWTTKPTPPSLVPVSDRAYFQDIQADRFWNYNWKDQNSHKYYLEPVYSRTTGSQQVILAMRPGKEGGWVSTIDFAAVSLLHGVLPKDLGYGYCVINHEGEVLFHSDDTRNQVENFLRESDNDTYLRSVIVAHESKSMNAQYLGAGHRLFVTPLPNTPWTLVTFRDKQIARAGCLEFIAYAIYLFCLYAVVLLILWGIYYIWNREDRSALLWPYDQRAANYYLSIGVNLLLALVSAVAIVSFNRWLVAILLVVLPGIGFLVHHYNLKADLADCGESLQKFIEAKPRLARRLGSHDLEEDFGRFAKKLKTFIEKYTPLNYKHGYVLTLVSLLMLVSVFPMLAFFKFAYDREMQLFVSLGQINLARGLEERAGRIQTQYLSADLDEPARKAASNLVAKRLDLTEVKNRDQRARYSDVYASFFFNSKLETAASEQASPASDSFDAAFEWIVPFQNSLSLVVRGLTRSMAGNNAISLLRSHANPNRQILHTEETVDGDPTHTILRVESDSASLGRGQSPFWWLGLMFMLLLIPTFLIWLITFIGRRVFLLNTDEPIVSYGDSVATCPPAQNLLVVASRFTSKNKFLEFLKKDGFEVRDLRRKTVDQWWVDPQEKQQSTATNGGKQGQSSAITEGDKVAITPTGPAGISKIVIDYFEHKFEDPGFNIQKAEMVEYLLDRNKTLIVTSTVDLAAYRFKQANSNPTPDETNLSDEGIDRTGVFNLLRRFYLEDTRKPEAFVKQLEDYEAQLHIDTLPDDRLSRQERKRIKAVLQTLKRECKSRDYLQSVGRSLLGLDHPDDVDKSMVSNGPDLAQLIKSQQPASGDAKNSTSQQPGNLISCLKLDDLRELNTERIYSRVQDRCTAYYYGLWETCSREEKLTLVHLATNRLISSRNPSLRRLLRSGLVSREPFLRPMNETFSRFVAAQATEFNLKAWKGAEEGGIWEDLKVPFAIILLVAGGFLFVSQRDLYNSTLAFVSAFAAAMPALFKVLGMFPGSKAGAA
jgi:hypothetical protein